MRLLGYFVAFSAALVLRWEAHAGGIPPATPDPEIQKLVSEISSERIQRTIYVLTSFKTRSTLSDQDPSGDGIGAAAAWIKAEFGRVSAASHGRLKVETDSFIQPVQIPRVPQATPLTNVVATLPGSRPDSADRIYVVSGHYDSRSKNVLDPASTAPGANDDASGTAAVLEMARVMSAYEFPATIVFITVAGEEQGLLGSTHWANQAKEKHLHVAGMLDNDIIGSSRSDKGGIDRTSVRLFAEGIHPSPKPTDDELRLISTGGENDSGARQLARSICDYTALYVPAMHVRVIYRADRYLRGGDHFPFLATGVPAVRFTEPAEDFLHQHEDPRVENGVTYGDMIKFVDFAYVADVARVNAATLAVLARAPASPSKVQLETARLGNDSTLRWEPNTEANLAGYRILWRETTSPTWENYLDVPKDVTRQAVEVSKDNVIFGLEAFDSAGHFSPAVFPSPRRTL